MQKQLPKVGDEVMAFRPLKNAGSLGPHDPEWEGGMRCRVTRVIESETDPRVELAPVGGLQIGPKNEFSVMTAAEAEKAQQATGLTQWAELAGD